MKKWWLAFRPKTLSAALAPILVASAYAWTEGRWLWWVSALALGVSLCLQIASNLFNDAIDFKKGADQHRSGPQRITQSGEASYRQVMLVACGFLLAAMLGGLPLVYLGGTPIFLLGLFSLLFAYAYTGGPFPLAYLGIADLFVVIFFGWIAVGGLAFLQLGYYHLDLFVLGTQTGLLCNIMLAVNNLRDHRQDRLVGKKTLVARFGEKFGRSFVVVLMLLPFFLNFYWLQTGRLFTAICSFLLFPFALLYLLFFLRAEVGPILNRYLALGSLYYLFFSVALAIGLVFDAGL